MMSHHRPSLGVLQIPELVSVKSVNSSQARLGEGGCGGGGGVLLYLPERVIEKQEEIV